MTAAQSIRGVWCALASPFDDNGDLDGARLAAHANRLLAQGVDGIAPFGTTGEGQSFSVAERCAGLDTLLAANVPPERIVAATGCAALTDTIALTRHAVANHCRGVLVLPPFFFKDLAPEGLYACYARLIEAVADARLAVYLYHIPQISGIPIDHDVVARLLRDFPGTIAGIKDSAGDLQHSLALAARFPALSILVGHEPHIPPLLAAGGAGTICGIANLYPREIRALHDDAAGSRAVEHVARIGRLLAAIKPYPFFAAFKALLADRTGDAAWDRLRPPLVRLSPAARAALLAAVRSADVDRDPVSGR
jgi:4-hydroxy-tetrahydrodipicolinate synthase